MPIIGYSGLAPEEIAPVLGASAACALLDPEEELQDRLAASALERPSQQAWGLKSEPDAPRAHGDIRVVTVPKVWDQLPEAVPRQLRERLLAIARRLQEDRRSSPLPPGGFQ